ncbi:hypothetical protein [Nonomuraea sp. NPDC002799]
MSDDDRGHDAFLIVTRNLVIDESKSIMCDQRQPHKRKVRISAQLAMCVLGKDAIRIESDGTLETSYDVTEQAMGQKLDGSKTTAKRHLRSDPGVSQSSLTTRETAGQRYGRELAPDKVFEHFADQPSHLRLGRQVRDEHVRLPATGSRISRAAPSVRPRSLPTIAMRAPIVVRTRAVAQPLSAPVRAEGPLLGAVIGDVAALVLPGG